MTSQSDGTSFIRMRLGRRRLLLLAAGTSAALLAACSSPPPAPTPAPAKPTEAPKPAAATTAPAASPAAAKPAAPAASPAAAAPAASPAAKPAASPAAAAPAASPAAAAKPAAAAGPATAKPSSVVPASQVMNWFAQSSQGGFFTALKDGHYEKQNIKMTNEQGGPQIASIPLVAAGRHTFGMSSADQVLLAREEGIPIVMVFPALQRNPQGLMFHKSNPVKDFADLNGRRVYVSGTGIYWRMFVAKYKLDKVEQLAYNGQLATFLSDETNVSQCFVTSEPIILAGQGKEVGYLVNADSGFNPYQNAMVCMESTIKEKPELVQAYVTASLAGWSEYLKNPKPTHEFIKSDFNKEKDLAIEEKVFEAEKAGFFTGPGGYDPKQIGRMTDARWSELYAMMREYNIIKKDIDYKAAFDASFVEKAHAAM